ncbi:MAG: methyltransferase, partial [Bosea sp. (in: a-proteobacteria)]
MAETATERLTEDWLLGGRLNLRQPAKGHRAGTDSVLLAASLPLRADAVLADLGAGAGTVGLIAALEQPTLSVVLVERDPQLSTISSDNIERNGLAGRVHSVCADVTAPARVLSEAGLKAGNCDCVAINPPYYPAGLKQGSPNP